MGRDMKNPSFFVTQKGRRRANTKNDVDEQQLEEMLASVARTSQSTLLLKKNKEMCEVRVFVETNPNTLLSKFVCFRLWALIES